MDLRPICGVADRQPAARGGLSGMGHPMAGAKHTGRLDPAHKEADRRRQLPLDLHPVQYAFQRGPETGGLFAAIADSPVVMRAAAAIRSDPTFFAIPAL